MTMESVGLGAKGAENIRKILNASPDSKESVEQVLKLEMAYKLVNQNTGRLRSLDAAKKYMVNNEGTMGIFPQLKVQMEKAIVLLSGLAGFPSPGACILALLLSIGYVSDIFLYDYRNPNSKKCKVIQ